VGRVAAAPQQVWSQLLSSSVKRFVLEIGPQEERIFHDTLAAVNSIARVRANVIPTFWARSRFLARAAEASVSCANTGNLAFLTKSEANWRPYLLRRGPRLDPQRGDRLCRLLPSLFELKAGNVYMQLASEPDRKRVLKMVRDHKKSHQRIFVGVINVLNGAWRRLRSQRPFLEAARVHSAS